MMGFHTLIKSTKTCLSSLFAVITKFSFFISVDQIQFWSPKDFCFGWQMMGLKKIPVDDSGFIQLKRTHDM